MFPPALGSHMNNDDNEAMVTEEVCSKPISKSVGSISSDSVREIITSGKPLYLQGTTIAGTLNLDGIACNAEIKLENCIIEGRLSCESATFQRKLTLRDVTLKQGANLVSATCHAGCIFEKVTMDSGSFDASDFTVHGQFRLVGCSIGGSTIFKSAQFMRQASFDSTHFAVADFEQSSFEASAEFRGCNLGDSFSFVNCRVGGDLIFSPNQGAERSIFRQSADFSRMNIAGRLDFACGSFEGKAVFAETCTKNSCDFSGATFASEGVDFSGAELGGADFSGVQFVGKCTLNGVIFHGDVTFEANKRKGLRSAVFQNGLDFTGTEVHGQAQFQGVQFSQETIFNGAVVHSDAYFGWNEDTGAPCRFSGKADFLGIRIEGITLFDKAEFEKDVMLRGAHLSADTSFWSCKFTGEIDFGNAEVEGNLVMRESCFAGKSIFDQLKVKGYFALAGSVFEKPCSFIATEIDGAFYCDPKPEFPLMKPVEFHNTARAEALVVGGRSTFCGVLFKGNASFEGAKLKGEVIAVGATFESCAKFNSCEFDSLVNFSSDLSAGEKGVTSFKDVTFAHARFRSDARFEGTRFRGRAIFTGTSFSAVSFCSADCPAEGSLETQFEDSIDLSGCEYDRIGVTWAALLKMKPGEGIKRVRHPAASRQRPYNRQPFIQMETSFRRSGEDRIADQIYLYMRWIERREKWLNRQWVRWFSDALEAAIANYGVRPFRLFMFAGLAVFLGMILFARWGTVVPSEKGRPPNIESTVALPCWDALGVSVHQFLPIDVPMGAQWSPATHAVQVPIWIFWRRVDVWLRPSYFATVMLRVPGWVLVSVGLASLTGFLRRIGPK